jgi:hypothetical protein
MKASTKPIAAAALPPVFPKTIHQRRPNPVPTNAKPAKRGSTSSQSRDTREDRGVREIKNSHSSQTIPHARQASA